LGRVVENPNASIVTIPIEEFTPIEVIPVNISYTSQELGLDEDIVVVGYYYCIHKTRAIERRINKRKRRESAPKKESSHRNIRRKACTNPKENAIYIASALNEFVGANSILVYEIAEALDLSRARVAKIEGAMNTIKDNLVDEFKKEASTTKQLHKQELKK